MAEVENRHVHGTSNATDGKKRKGFWSNIFNRSSNATNTDEKEDEKQPKRKGFMNSLATNARQAATKEVMHLAEQEAMKQVEAQLHDNNNSNNGSQPTNTTTTTTTANAASQLDTSTPSDVLSAPTSWAKRMVGGVQQKAQGLQNLASS